MLIKNQQEGFLFFLITHVKTSKSLKKGQGKYVINYLCKPSSHNHELNDEKNDKNNKQNSLHGWLWWFSVDLKNTWGKETFSVTVSEFGPSHLTPSLRAARGRCDGIHTTLEQSHSLHIIRKEGTDRKEAGTDPCWKNFMNFLSLCNSTSYFTPCHNSMNLLIYQKNNKLMWSESPISQLTLNNCKCKLGKLINKWISQGRETFHIQSTLGTEITRLFMIVHDTRPYLTDKERACSREMKLQKYLITQILGLKFS